MIRYNAQALRQPIKAEPPKPAPATWRAVVQHPKIVRPKITTLDLVHMVAAQTNTMPEEIAGHSRLFNVAHARQLAMYLAYVYLDMQPVAIGQRFDRDRTTVTHAISAVKERIRTDERTAKIAALLADQIKAKLA